MIRALDLAQDQGVDGRTYVPLGTYLLPVSRGPLNLGVQRNRN